MGGGGYLRGVCSKKAMLRRGFKQSFKIWREHEAKLVIIQKFINNSASQIIQSGSHHLMIVLQC